MRLSSIDHWQLVQVRGSKEEEDRIWVPARASERIQRTEDFER